MIMGTVLFALFATLFLFAISWIITCGFVYLIMCCFGLVFTWSIATGIWLSLILLSIFLKSNSSGKKEKKKETNDEP